MFPFPDSNSHLLAVNNQVIPALEAFAANPGRLDRARRRFDRDEPPAYCSSTDSNYEEDDDPEPIPDLQEIATSIAAPLNEANLRNVVSHMQKQGFTRPGRIYVKEARHETTRLHSFIRTGPCNPNTERYLTGSKSRERHAVIVRHYIKKRWQRLGIWDSSWGIPGRVQTHFEDGVHVRTLSSTIFTEREPIDRPGMPDKDNEELWRWRNLREYMPSDPSDPVRQAVELRRCLRRGEPMPLPPQDNLTSCASPKEMEQFLVSRPFFLFELEIGEEFQRRWRVPLRKSIPVIKWNIIDTVVNRWEKRGDWNEEWAERDYRGNYFTGWKWPHESDALEAIDYSELNSRDDIDFTPSEIDALEAIEARHPILPTSRAAQETRYMNLKSTPPLRRSGRIAEIEAKKALASLETFVEFRPGRSQQPEIGQGSSRRTGSSPASAAPPTAKVKGGRPKSAVALRGKGRGAKRDIEDVADAAEPHGVKKRGSPRKSMNPPPPKTAPRKRTTAPKKDSRARTLPAKENPSRQGQQRTRAFTSSASIKTDPASRTTKPTGVVKRGKGRPKRN